MNSAVKGRHAGDWNRRQFVRGLGLGMLGLGLPEVLRLQAQARADKRGGQARSCIMIFLFGGPSQIDTWDMKPEAPREYRGEFKPIATAVPGIRLCEHLPRTARLAQHLALVRSLTMTDRVIGNGDHHADTYYMLTGHRPDRSFFVEGINRKPHADDWPFLGSTVAYRRPPAADLPGVVQLPARSGEVTGYINPGQFSGLLGPGFEPVMVRGTLEKPFDLAVPQLAVPADVDPRRLHGRRDLVGRLDAWQAQHERTGTAFEGHDTYQSKAFTLLTSDRTKRAFDLNEEPRTVRERYGPDINGQSMLLARRLVEAGVPFVCVHWTGRIVGAGLSWDTHTDNFGQLKNVLLPAFDAGYAALLEDLEQRGLLDETLVLVCAEMGRTPKVADPRNTNNEAPGRDHWVHCQTAVLAGGGIRGGQVYGASDRIAGYPSDRPVSPEHLAATVYQAMGIAENLVIQDRQRRLLSLLEDGQALPLFG
jgi:hypothetical protein